MTIKLRIDNLDRLPDGGPMQFTATRSGFGIGRSEALDWTLPDPSRFISGTHCEVRYEDGGYWLSDVSTNGTFLNGARQRMKSPHRLADGDRIGIGHYILCVGIESDGAVVPPPASASEDIWGSAGPLPAPIDRRELMPARQRGRRAPDFSQEFLGLPGMRPGPGSPPASREREEFAETGRHRGAPEAEDGPRRRGDSFFSDPNGGLVPGAVGPAGPAARSAGDAEVIRRFAQGAGIDPAIFAGRDAGETAEEIGRVLRIVVDDVQKLLQARQAAKLLARSSKRTMLGRINNPLKFLPTAEEILEVLFTGRRAGYLPAVAAFEEAFGDLKRHEIATYAAMQAALARLLSDVSPEAIEGKVTGSAFTSRKARNWDMYVARWEAKTEPHENGMLDVFLAYFAEAYDEDAADR